ncbi:MAG: sensor histidine kinase [Anaerolineales bacterium]
MFTRLRPAQLPLRLRLTLWYLLSLGLILLLFGLLLYWQVQHNLLAQVDSALQLAAAQASATVGIQDGSLVFQTAAASPALARLSEDTAIRLVTDDGTVWDSLGRTAEAPVLRPTAGYLTYFDGDDTWRVYSERVDLPAGAPGGWLQVTQTLDSVEQTLSLLRLQLLWGVPLALLLAGAGGYFLASRALRPIDRITRTAQAINSSDLSTRIGHSGPADELGRLAATFDEMLDRLQSAFDRERRFTADAAHELRTPLTALKGRIGVTLSQPREAAEYGDSLQDMEQQVDRLIRLSSDLLFITRLDQGQVKRRLDPIALDDLLAAVVEQLRPLAEAKAISLPEPEARGLTVPGDMDLMIRLFMNLLDNAIKFTPPGGRVSVEARRSGEQVTIAIRDTGAGIPAEHRAHLFERFYRVGGDRSRTDDQGGAGLGLAIAHEIARAHAGRLTVESTVGEGTVFTVKLPFSPLQTAVPATDPSGS